MAKLSEELRRLRSPGPENPIVKNVMQCMPAVRDSVRQQLPIGPTGDLRLSVSSIGPIYTNGAIRFTVYLDQSIGDVAHYAKRVLTSNLKHTGAPNTPFTQSFYDFGKGATRAQRYRSGYNAVKKFWQIKFTIGDAIGRGVQAKSELILSAIQAALT